jgi:cell wall-associated NlpC family hydrolase
MFLCREHPEAWRPLNPPYFYIDADSNGEYRFYSLCYNHNFTYFTMAPYNGYTFVSKGEPWLGEYFMPDSLCTSFIEQYFTLLDISQAIVGLSGCISSGYDNFWLYRFASTHAFSFPGRGDKILWGVGYRLDGYECPPIDQWIPARLRWQGNQGSLQLIPGGGAGAVVSISDDGRVAVGQRRLNGYYVPFRWIGDTVENFLPRMDPDEQRRNCYATAIDQNGEIVLGYCEAYSLSRGYFRYNFLRLQDGSVHRFEDLFADAFRWDANHIRAIDISPNGRYLLVELSNADCFAYGVIDRHAAALDFPESLTVIMRNASAPANTPDSRHAYPFVGDIVNLAVLAKVGNRFYYDTTCAPLTGRWFRPGVDFMHGGGERMNTSHTDLRYNVPALYTWTGARPRFVWFRSKQTVDRETNNSRQVTGNERIRWRTNRGTASVHVLHRYYNYELDRAYPEEGRWFISLPMEKPGTYRYYVRVRHPRGNRWFGSAQPLPGAWQPSNDDAVFNNISLFNQHWSQNCDEESELALRISVREQATWVSPNPDDRKRQFVEWLSSFLDVPYEWGGHWYGGRADDKPQRSDGTLYYPDRQRVYYPGDAGYQGYGVDCSGLVYAAGLLAGYNIPYRTVCRDFILNTRLTEAVNLRDLHPGDLLVHRERNPDGSLRSKHVVVVYKIYRKRCVGTRCEIDMSIIHAAGRQVVPLEGGGSEIRGEKVMIERVKIIGQDDIITVGQTADTQITLKNYIARRLREPGGE